MTHQQPSRRCSHLVPPKLLRRGRSCPSEASQEARPLPTRPPAGLVRKLRLRPWSVRIREGEEAQLRWGLTGPPASPPQPPHGPGRRQASRVPGIRFTATLLGHLKLAQLQPVAHRQCCCLARLSLQRDGAEGRAGLPAPEDTRLLLEKHTHAHATGHPTLKPTSRPEEPARVLVTRG